MSSWIFGKICVFVNTIDPITKPTHSILTTLGTFWAYTAKSKINQGVCFISTLCILFKTTMVHQTRVLQWKICIYNMTNFPVCYQQETYFFGVWKLHQSYHEGGNSRFVRSNTVGFMTTVRCLSIQKRERTRCRNYSASGSGKPSEWNYSMHCMWAHN